MQMTSADPDTCRRMIDFDPLVELLRGSVTGAGRQ